MTQQHLAFNLVYFKKNLRRQATKPRKTEPNKNMVEGTGTGLTLAPTVNAYQFSEVLSNDRDEYSPANSTTPLPSLPETMFPETFKVEPP